VVRPFIYALLIKYGFQVNAAGRLLNPAAVFCANRNLYYAMLSRPMPAPTLGWNTGAPMCKPVYATS